MPSDSNANIAAWQLEAKGPLTVKEADVGEPGPGEVRVKIMATALQPAEAWQYHMAIMPNFKYPGILGSQCAGVVDAVGPDVTKVKVGDRVAGNLNNYANGGDPLRASLQRYTIAEVYEMVNIGDELSYRDAVAWITGTPASTLFVTLGMDYPTVEPPSKPEPNGKKVLIWGGSGAMGSLCIVYAKLAGYTVITTCSKHNFDLVKGFGADYVFDRNDPNVADEISKFLPIDFWLDTISKGESLSQIIKIATVQHGKTSENIKLVVYLPLAKVKDPPEIPSFVKTQMHFFKNKLPENQKHMEWLFGTSTQQGYLEKGLRAGWIKGVPSKSVGGLQKAEGGIKMVHRGENSGVKLVVEPWLE